MTIKQRLQALEEEKTALLALNLPDDTQLVTSADMGVMYPYEESRTRSDFFITEAFKSSEDSLRYYKYPYVNSEKLKFKKTVVSVL